MTSRISVFLVTLFAIFLGSSPATAQDTAPRLLTPATFEDADYPLGALAAHQGGRVVLNVNVGPAGMADDASIVTSTGSEVLDRASIRVAKSRWRFEPARRNGRPIAGTTQVEANWTLPLSPTPHTYIEVADGGGATMAEPTSDYEARYSDYPPAAAAGRAQGVAGVRYRVGADGTVQGAEIAVSSGHSRLDAAAIRIAQNRSFMPARRNGQAVASEQSLTVAFSVLPTNASSRPPPCYATPILGRDAVQIGTTPYRVEVGFDTAKYRTRWQIRPVTDWIGVWVRVSENGDPTDLLLYTDEGWMVPSASIAELLVLSREYPTGRGGCWYYDPVQILG